MEIFYLVILIILSGFFSGVEIALFSLSEAKVKSLMDQGVKRADALSFIKSQPQRLLSTILIGNNIVNIGASAYATLLATDYFGDAGAGIAVGVMTFLVLVFGEITPKAIASAKNVEISLAVAPLMKFLMWILTPIVWILEKITTGILKSIGATSEEKISEEDIRAMITIGKSQGAVEREEARLLEKVFEFNDITAEDAMTVAREIYSVDGNKKLSEVMNEMIQSPFSRIPVYVDDFHDITGVVQMSDVLKHIGNTFGGEGRNIADVRVSELASKPYIVPETKPINEILEEFKKRRKHIAIVVDETGHTTGLITMEDILEQLVGQIADETDVDEYVIKRIDRHTILVDGDEEIGEVNDFFNVDIVAPKKNTISWLILEEIKEIPKTGDVFEIQGLALTIIEATDRSIEKVKIEKPAA